MIQSQVSQCAAPACECNWHRMGEGKLFVFHVKEAGTAVRETKIVWLCENCFDSWEVSLDKNGRIVLRPLQRIAS